MAKIILTINQQMSPENEQGLKQMLEAQFLPQGFKAVIIHYLTTNLQ